MGSITVFRRKLFVSQCQKISPGNPSVHQKNVVAKILRLRRGSFMVLSKIFRLTGPRNFKVSLLSFRIFLVWTRRGFQYFPSKLFSLKVPKISVWEPFNVSENFGYRKTLCIRRGYHFFPFKLLCHTAKEIHGGTLLCFKNIPVSKTFMHSRGGLWHQGFVERNFVSKDRIEKLGKGTRLFSRKILVTKNSKDESWEGGCITIFRRN